MLKRAGAVIVLAVSLIVAAPSSASLSSTASCDERTSAAGAAPVAEPNSWLVALVSGFAGAILTVLAERLIERRHERKALLALLVPVAGEVAMIESSALARSARAEDAPFPFDRALPTEAWTILRASGIAWRLSSKPALFRALVEMYEAVEDANHRSGVAVTLFHLSQGADRTPLESSEYLSRATRLAIDPYRTVAARATFVAAELAKEKLSL